MGFLYPGVAQRNLCYAQGRYMRQTFLLWVTLISRIASTAAQASAATTPQPCGGTLVGSGTIQSPNYPRNYPDNARCSWRLLSRSNDTGIRIQFNTFALEKDYDYITIHNERNNSKRYTGNVKPPTTLVGKEARIEFYSDVSNSMIGFTASFTSTNVTNPYQCLTNDVFWCNISQKCISTNWLCDGYQDCRLNEDELSCHSTTLTSTRSPQSDCLWPGKFWCRRSAQCVQASYRCDNYKDCVYGEDEDNCTTSSRTPQGDCNWLGKFWCSRSAQCVQASYRCDNDKDCVYGEDEDNCPRTTLSPQSECQRLSKFWCSRSAKCVPTSYKCDNYNDCVYGEDEANCQTLQQQCAQMQRFWCGASRQCINSLWRCDDANDCLYGEDEDGCTNLSTKTIAAIVAGSVCGVVLLVLLLVGLMRVMTIRRLRQATPRSNNYLQSTVRPSATAWSTPATYASQFGTPIRQAGGAQGTGVLSLDQYAPPSYDATVRAYATGEYVHSSAQSREVRPSANTPAFTSPSTS